MSPEETLSLDDRLLAALLELDEAILGQNQDSGATQPESLDPSILSGEAASLFDCLQLLEQIWPRRGSFQGNGNGGRPQQIGRFTILEELGRGGFGIVYKAHDPMLGRALALKVPHPPALVNPDLERRFLREARAAGGLDHPSIATVFEAGRAETGCYIASALCEGPSLAAWLRSRERPAPPRLTAEIVAQLADAVQHAHDRGILHRDLKPSNVLLWPEPSGSPASTTNGLGFIPKVTDFGLARIAEETGEETRTGIPLGSPPYMAPEQAAGQNREVGPSSDIYGLGTILYELLTGRPPFRGESNVETIRMVLDLEVVPPRSLRARLPRDLETICLTCLEKEPGRRYASAAALADDLRRFLEGRPIRARRPSALGRAWRSARRHPWRSVALAMPVVMILAAVLGISVSNAQLRLERDRADQLAEEARELANEARRQRHLADEQRQIAERHLYASRLREARAAIDLGQVERAQELLAAAGDLRAEGVAPDFAEGYLSKLARRDVEILRGHDRSIEWMFPFPNGRLVTVDSGGGAITWDLDRRLLEQKASLPSEFWKWPSSRLSGPGLLVALEPVDPTGNPYKTVGLYDPASGRRVGEIPPNEGNTLVSAARLASGTALGVLERQPDGQSVIRLFAVGPSPSFAMEPIAEIGPSQIAGFSSEEDHLLTFAGGQLRRHDAATGRVIHEVPFDLGGRPASNLEGSPDGRLAIFHQPGSPSLVVEPDSGAIIDEIPTLGTILWIFFAPEHEALVVVEHGGRTHLWQRLDGSCRSRLIVDPSEYEIPRSVFADFSPDGQRLALGNWGVPGHFDRPQILDVTSGQVIANFPGRSMKSGSFHFTSDGRTLVVANENDVALWQLDPSEPAPAVSGHDDEVWSIAFTPDGRWMATGSDDTDEDKTLKIWDLSDGREVLAWKAHPATVSALAFNPDGRLLASACLESKENLRLWEPETGRLLAELEGHTDKVRTIAISPDGQTLISGGDDGAVRVWDIKSRRCTQVLEIDGFRIYDAIFLEGGRTVAATDSEWFVHVWDVANGRRLRSIRLANFPLALAVSPDGSILAVADNQGCAELFDAQTGAHLRTIRDADGELRAATFTPDGSALAVAGTDQTIRLWDVATGQGLLSLDGHKAQINDLSFSPDGLTLVSGDHAGTILLWRAEAPSPVTAK